MKTHNYAIETEGNTTTILFSSKKDLQSFKKDHRNRERVLEEVRQQTGSRFVCTGVQMTERQAARVARRFDAAVADANRPEMTVAEAFDFDNKKAEQLRRFKNETL